MTDNFDVKFNQKKDELIINCSGQLTINSIEKISEKIKDQIKEVSKVSIDVKEVDNIDLTFIQLIYSIKNSGKKNGYQVAISMELPEDLKSLIINAGFGKLLN